MAGDDEDLRDEVRALQARLDRIEQRLEAMAAAVGQRRDGVDRAATPMLPRQSSTTKATSRPSDASPPPAAFTPPRDLEALLGTTWLPRLGMAVLVLGAVFFIAYTIEKEWISLTGQIVLGILGGLALAAAGEWMRVRDRFGTLPAVLTAGGVVIAYFAVYAAHHFDAYRAATGVGLVADLVLLGLVAAGGIGLALRHESPTLVGMAYALGYVTALIGQPVALLSLGYVTILGVSLAAVLWLKGWTQVAAPAAASTWVVLAVLRARIDGAEWSYTAAVTALGVAFWFTAARASRKHDDLGATTAAIASAGASALLWWNMWRVDEDAANTVLLGLAALHALAAFALPRPGLQGAAGLAAGILAFIWAPLALDAAAVTVTWAVITAAFAAFGFRTGAPWPRWLAYAVAGVLFVRVLFHDPNTWMEDAVVQGAVAVIAATGAFAAVHIFATVRAAPRAPGEGLRASDLAIVGAALAPLGYLTVLLAGYIVSVAWALEGVALVAAGVALDRREVRLTGAGLLVLVVGRVMVVDLEGLDTGWRIVVFLAVGALLLGASLLFVKARRPSVD